MAPYSPATHHLIGAEEIAKMKPTAVLVNSARGGVVTMCVGQGMGAAALFEFPGEG